MHAKRHKNDVPTPDDPILLCDRFYELYNLYSAQAVVFGTKPLS